MVTANRLVNRLVTLAYRHGVGHVLCQRFDDIQFLRRCQGREPSRWPVAMPDATSFSGLTVSSLVAVNFRPLFALGFF